MKIFTYEDIEPAKQFHTLFCEKYRPSKLDDYIGNDLLKAKVQSFIDNKDIPHLLLYGKSGTGKTTLAKLIVSNIDCESLYINASSENNVETMREKITTFMSTLGLCDTKIVILDEGDYVTQAAQAILRNLMETFSMNARIIITCNYPERIITPIKSRCQSYEVIPPNKVDIAKHLAKILLAEHIEFNIPDIAFLVDLHYPDIRKMLNEIQWYILDGKLTIDKKSIQNLDYKNDIVEIIKNNKINKYDSYVKIRETIANNTVRDFTDLYRYLYDTVETFAGTNQTASIILTLAEGQYQDAIVVDKEICIMSTILKILDVLKK